MEEIHRAQVDTNLNKIMRDIDKSIEFLTGRNVNATIYLKEARMSVLRACWAVTDTLDKETTDGN